MFNFSLKTLEDSGRKLVKRFPLPVCFAIGLTLALIWMVPYDKVNNPVIYFFTSSFILAILMTLMQERFPNSQKLKPVWAGLELLIFLDFIWQFIYLGDSLGQAHTLARLSILFALFIGMLYLPFLSEKDDRKTWNFTQNLLKWGILSYGIGLAMTLGTLLLLACIESLFQVKFDDVLVYVFIVFIVLLPLLILMAHLPQKTEMNQLLTHRNGFLENAVRYLIIPLVSCYLLVLYLYLLKIMITWTLPQGMVSSTVTLLMFGIILIEILLYPSLLSGQAKPMEKWVSLQFPALALPLLLLMTVGIMRRLSDYGITSNRLYLLTLNLWFYGVCVGLLLNKVKRIHWIFYSFAGLFLLTSAQPWNFTELGGYTQMEEFVPADENALPTFYYDQDESDIVEIPEGYHRIIDVRTGDNIRYEDVKNNKLEINITSSLNDTLIYPVPLLPLDSIEGTHTINYGDSAVFVTRFFKLEIIDDVISTFLDGMLFLK